MVLIEKQEVLYTLMSTAASEEALACAWTWWRLHDMQHGARAPCRRPAAVFLTPSTLLNLQTEEHAKAVCAPANHYTPLTEEEVQVRDAFGTSIDMLALCSLANDAAIEAPTCRAQSISTLHSKLWIP